MGKRFRTYLQHPKMRAVVAVVAVISIVAGVAMAGAAPQAADASNVMNVVKNGSFEGGFESQPGCGLVGSGWSCFTNGGAANYGFYDEMWEPVVSDGAHSQLIEINTNGVMAPDADRYAGLYQTVGVTPGEVYKLSLKGMIRTTKFDGDPWRYRVEVGYTHGPHGEWQQVGNWQDVGWDDYYPRTEPGGFSGFMGQIKAKEEHLTLYIRVWKKWGTSNEEIDVNLDEIRLVGMVHGMGGKPMAEMAPEKPMAEMKPMGHAEGPMMKPGPAEGEKAMAKEQVVCGGPNLVYNGGFEHGFNAATIGEVGRGWGSFTNGGAANYGFYDDMWPPVVASGEHAQLIEINTKGIVGADSDRYAGIYQQIGKLEPGKRYELTVRGVLRGEGGELSDPHRWEAQAGMNWGGDTEWEHVKSWQGMDLGGIQERSAPESIGAYKTHFTAKDGSMVLFLRGWFKWGESNLEMDLNLDDISIVGCEMGKMGPEKAMMGGMMPQRPMGEPMMSQGPAAPERPMAAPPMGEAPAGQRAVAPEAPMAAPPMGEPAPAGQGPAAPERPADQGPTAPERPADAPPASEAPAGQGPAAPERPADAPPASEAPAGQGPAAPERPADAPPAERGPAAAGCIHVVRAGDSLSAIADQYGTTVEAFSQANNISDPGAIYVGQELTIPGCELSIAPIVLEPMELAGVAPMQAVLMHRVGPGETLNGIAARYGADPQAVATINGLASASFLYVGQQLRMP